VDVLAPIQNGWKQPPLQSACVVDIVDMSTVEVAHQELARKSKIEHEPSDTKNDVVDDYERLQGPRLDCEIRLALRDDMMRD
jgi:hypothetical protein